MHLSLLQQNYMSCLSSSWYFWFTKLDYILPQNSNAGYNVQHNFYLFDTYAQNDSVMPSNKTHEETRKQINTEYEESIPPLYCQISL